MSKLFRKTLNARAFTGILAGALCLLAGIAACTPEAQVAELATSTLAPIVSMTPRFTATPVPSKTPLPTFTYTPSDTPIPPTPSDTLAPSPTPPTIGIINSLQEINVRSGPGGSFSAFTTLRPGTGVEVIGQNEEGTWLLVRMEDGREGWVFGQLIRLQPSPTPFPTLTPSPDLTRLFLGTPLPTALLGGGTVTPTPPRSVVTPTLVEAAAVASPTPTAPATEDTGIPVINLDAINQTATLLAQGVNSPTPLNIATPTPREIRVVDFTPTPSGPTPTGGAAVPPTSAPVAGSGGGEAQDRVRVLALCDDPAQRNPAPTNLGAGSTIIVWWSWFATQEDLIRQHLDAATYEVRVDGNLLTNINQYRTNISRPSNDYVVSWFVPYLTPLTAGEHRITYRVTWSQQITDGYKRYGPGTNNLVEEGSCTFTVR